MSFLALTGVRKSFGVEAVVKDFNLTVERGELVTFFGAPAAAARRPPSG